MEKAPSSGAFSFCYPPRPCNPKMIAAKTYRAFLLLVIAAITIAIYWQGLHGPYLLDDVSNLQPLKRWLDGDLGWRGVVLDNRSGMLGRTVSMASFIADAWRTQSMDSGTFKPTNLLIHLMCGLVLYAFLRRILTRDPHTARARDWLALLLMAIWLWTPIQVSTVLYVIQRMAQLAALFMLLALWAYMVAREHIEANRRSGLLLLWIAVPALTALAALSKENGVLALPLAMTLEWLLYPPEAGRKRPLIIVIFFSVSVVLPAIVAMAWLALHPHFITGGYGLRDFTLGERLLTEPRILWSYIQTMLLPVGPQMGIYHDNYLLSTGLTHPWTTLPALLAWAAVVSTAWLLRRKFPMYTAGVAFFLVGHAIESSIIALELYFEHRNYLPSIGVLMALTGLIAPLLEKAPVTNTYLWRIAAGLMVAIPLTYAVGTWVHAGTWSSGRLFYLMQETYNPTSPRLQSDLTTRAMLAGDLDGALGHIAIGERNSVPAEQMTATIWRFLAYCETGRAAPASLYEEFEARSHGAITNFAMIGWDSLAGRIERGCPGMDLKRLTTAAAVWLERAPLPASSQNIWRTRYNLARIIAINGDLIDAAKVNRQAWIDSSYNNGIGVLQFQLSATLGDVATCREVFAHLERGSGGDDYRLNRAVATFREALDKGQIQSP